MWTWLIELIGRIRAFVRFRALDSDFDQEIQSHLEMLTEENVQRGMSRAEAERAARLRFGGSAQLREAHRDVRGLPFLDVLFQDIRHGARVLWKNASFTAIAVITLALGIGANTAIFSVVNAVLLRPLPYKDSDRLVEFFENAPGADGVERMPNGAVLPLGQFAAFRSQVKTLSHVGAYHISSMTLSRPEGSVRLSGGQVSASVFQMLGATPAAGRFFDEAEELKMARVLVLSYRTWQQHFGGSADTVGRNIVVNGQGYEVVGVTAPDFRFPDSQTDYWTPFALPAATEAYAVFIRPPLIARLSDGVTLEEAAAEMNVILPPLQIEPQRDIPSSMAPRFGLIPLKSRIVAPVAPALRVLAAAVGFVLLIACVNVANLLLGQGAVRQREIAVRRALGGTPLRLIRQLLIESVMLALAGGAAGTVFAFGGVHLLRTLGAALPRRDLGIGVSIPRLDEVAIDTSVLLFALGISVVTGVLFGLAPAIRQSSRNLTDQLREGVRSTFYGSGGPGHSRLQRVLVVSEVAMATVLLVAAGLLLHSFVKLANVHPGYDATNVLTFQSFLPRGGQNSRPLNTDFAEKLIDRFRQLPGIRHAGYALQLPMVRMQMSAGLRTTREPDPAAPAPPRLGASSPEWPDTRYVSQDFLNVMGIRLIAGRGFTENDRAGAPPVMLINEKLARSGFLGENPLGKRVYSDGDRSWEIVGIVEDVHQMGLDDEPGPQIFVHVRQALVPPPPDASGPYFAVRIERNAGAVIASLRSVVRQLEPDAALDNFATMQQVVSNSITRPRLYASLLGIFAGVAVLLSAIGVYGTVSNAVTQRTREIGVRIALGARRSQVLGLMLRHGLVSAAIGIVLGTMGAAAVTRYLEHMLFGLAPLDLFTFVIVGLMFAAVAALAAYVPARRAAKVDPVVALRCE